MSTLHAKNTERKTLANDIISLTSASYPQNISVIFCSIYIFTSFFIDFDTAYLVSSSGNAIRARNQYIYTIVIDIREIDTNVSEEPGAYVDLRSGKYTIGIDASNNNTELQITATMSFEQEV